MLLQIIDSVAKEEIVAGGCSVTDLVENGDKLSAGGRISMKKLPTPEIAHGHVGESEYNERRKDGGDVCDLELALHSPVGGETITYKWPLVSGDERDESLEILETIRWVCKDVPEMEKILGNNEVHAMYDPRSYPGMRRLCDRYNGAISTLRQMRWISEKSPPTPSSSSSSLSCFQFASTGLLKHILQVCYNKAVEDPDKLNQYEPFSPEVYGETSFELVHELMKVTKFGEDDIFIDLGSGVGQVVLQVAGSTPCKFCYGIEKSDWPAKYSESLSTEFKKWMSFFGKCHSQFRLEKGDFLAEDKVEVINSASIIFVNNFAFGPQVDHQLKLRFANVKEGARIVSSRAFCPLNFHITDRNLSDIGTIMKVEELTALPAAVSWTDKPFAYFLHTIDRSLLEKYFNNLKTNCESGTRKPLGTERSKRKFLNGGSVKSESGDDTVLNKRPRKHLTGEVDSGVESSIGNQSKKKVLNTLIDNKKKYKLKKGPKKNFTLKRGRKKLNHMTLNTLDIFHRQISSGSNSFDDSSKLIFNDHFMASHQTKEDQITTSHLNWAIGPIKNLMATYERQLMFFYQHMQSSTYKDQLKKELETEERKRIHLSSKISSLESEVRLLRRHGVEIMNKKINEATSQTSGGSVLKEAHCVLEDRSNMERQMSHLKEHITKLEHEHCQLLSHQQAKSNGIMPTLHDLLKVPSNSSPLVCDDIDQAKYKTPFLPVANTASACHPNPSTNSGEGRSNLLMDLTEMLLRRNIKGGAVSTSTPGAFPRKHSNKRTATALEPALEHNPPAPKVAPPRKKKSKNQIMDDHNNNSMKAISPHLTSHFPTPHLNKYPESVIVLQQQILEEQCRSLSSQKLKQQPQQQKSVNGLSCANANAHIRRQQPQMQQDQQRFKLQQDQQKVSLNAPPQQTQQESKAPKQTRKKQLKLLQVTQEQQAIGHFPYKIVCNDPEERPGQKSQNQNGDPGNTMTTPSSDITMTQAPFLSKLTAPNFAIVDFSQLVKSRGVVQPSVPPSQAQIPAINQPLCFPIGSHMFTPPNFMLFKPTMGSDSMMSTLSKPLFSSLAPVSSAAPSSTSAAAFVSFSSPLLSLPLFQPTSLVSNSVACSSKLEASMAQSASSLTNSSKHPHIVTKPSSLEHTKIFSHHDSFQVSGKAMIQLASSNDQTNTTGSGNKIFPNDCNPNSASQHQPASSSSPASGFQFHEQEARFHHFLSDRKEILATR